jgi:hypothetical protein
MKYHTAYALWPLPTLTLVLKEWKKISGAFEMTRCVALRRMAPRTLVARHASAAGVLQ